MLEAEDELNFIENDFYAGKAKKKLTQMEDPDNSMIVLRYEQEAKDLALIRIIKSVVVWFLQEGPAGTDQFFYQYKQEDKFMPKQLKLKIKSLKVYLDTIYAIVSEDCVSPAFVEDLKLICQCALMGCSHYAAEKEEAIPTYCSHNWVYQLCWLAKELYKQNPKDNRSMANAVNAIEGKVLDIFEKLSGFRINLQVQKYLMMFRDFQERNLDPHVAVKPFNAELLSQFNELFKMHQIDVDIKKTDKYLRLKKAEGQQLTEVVAKVKGGTGDGAQQANTASG